jgi:hypothetical protein
MRKSKVKRLRKKWLKSKQNPQYNIKSQIVEGQTFRQFKKKAI